MFFVCKSGPEILAQSRRSYLRVYEARRGAVAALFRDFCESELMDVVCVLLATRQSKPPQVSRWLLMVWLRCMAHGHNLGVVAY